MQSFTFKIQKPTGEICVDDRHEIYSLLRESRAAEEEMALARSIVSQVGNSYHLQRTVAAAVLYPVLLLVWVVFLAMIVLQDQTLLTLEIAVVAGILLYLWSKHPKGKRVIHFVILKIPLVGKTMREMNAARTARALSLLLDAGVSILTSVRVTRQVVKNIHSKIALEEVEKAIQDGGSISGVLISHTHIYPLFLSEMVAVAEEQGEMSAAFKYVAYFYERSISEQIQIFSRLTHVFFVVILLVIYWLA